MIDGPWRRYFVVCAESIVPHWWCRFLRPGYRHCYLLVWEGAVWLHVDPTMDRARVVILDLFEGYEDPRAWIEDATARIFEAWPEPESDQLRTPWLIGPITCVELVKAFLGIRSFWIWSPWQLAQALRKRRHHRESKEAEEIRRGKGAFGSADSGTFAPGRGDQRAQAPDHPGADHEPGVDAVG
jgi:hypothetical protein